MTHLAVFWVCAALLAGCGAASLSRAGPGELSHGGISISVLDNWYGRILFSDQQGTGASTFEVANFKLAHQEGFEPPKELPAGQEDPIKAMAGDDVLIEVDTHAPPAPVRSLPVQITKNSFVSPDNPSVPCQEGHAVAREAGCFNGRCLLITVDFATRPPSNRVLDSANAVLRSLKVEEP